MTPLLNNLTAPECRTTADRPGDDDTELVGSRLERIDPDNFRHQSSTLADDADSEAVPETSEPYDEPVDEDGDPTDVPDHGEHDHHQDDKYAPGGHVTRGPAFRSGSVQSAITNL